MEKLKKILDVSGWDTKIGEVEKKIPNHDVCITTQEFNKLMAENFTARLKQANLASTDDIAGFVKKGSF